MSHFAECFLLLVRSSDDVPRASREVGRFLAFQRAQFPSTASRPGGALVGIWVNPALVDAPSEVWDSISGSGAEAFRIRTSIGVNGVWSLVWLDAHPADKIGDFGRVREGLVSALMEEQSLHQCRRNLPFVPVFDSGDDHYSVLLRTERLRELFPGLIDDPMTWNTATGALAGFPIASHSGRAI